MGERNPEATVPTADRDIAAGSGPKPPWTKPTIRVMQVVFTNDSVGRKVLPERASDANTGTAYTPPSS